MAKDMLRSTITTQWSNQMWLENPGKTLMTAGAALVVGAMVIIVSLSSLHWAVG
ncbi:MAG: hypothetical protein RIC89_20885 [Pseudomonadales bacterium]